jgi:hypothetical protein
MHLTAEPPGMAYHTLHFGSAVGSTTRLRCECGAVEDRRRASRSAASPADAGLRMATFSFPRVVLLLLLHAFSALPYWENAFYFQMNRNMADRGLFYFPLTNLYGLFISS